MSAAPYIAFATVLDRLDRWWASKREEWAVAKLIVDEVANGYVPSPECVGLAPAPTRAADECASCDGTGRVENDAAESLMAPMWATCPTCEGAGTLPEPEENPRPVDVDDCTACDGQGVRLVLVEGDQADQTCSLCAGTGEIGPGRGWVA